MWCCCRRQKEKDLSGEQVLTVPTKEQAQAEKAQATKEVRKNQREIQARKEKFNSILNTCAIGTIISPAAVATGHTVYANRATISQQVNLFVRNVSNIDFHSIPSGLYDTIASHYQGIGISVGVLLVLSRFWPQIMKTRLYDSDYKKCITLRQLLDEENEKPSDLQSRRERGGTVAYDLFSEIVRKPAVVVGAAVAGYLAYTNHEALFVKMGADFINSTIGSYGTEIAAAVSSLYGGLLSYVLAPSTAFLALKYLNRMFNELNKVCDRLWLMVPRPLKLVAEMIVRGCILAVLFPLIKMFEHPYITVALMISVLVGIGALQKSGLIA